MDRLGRRISADRIVALCAFLGVFGLAGSGSANDGPHEPMSVMGLADKGLILIGPVDPRFDDMANEVLHGRHDAEYEILKPYSVILQNETNKTVVAYSIRWEALDVPWGHSDTDGRHVSRNFSLVQDTGLLDGDHRQTLPDEDTIAPGDFKIVMFETEIGRKSDSAGLVHAGNPTDLQAELQLEVHEFDEDTNVSAAIDGVFFDDGSFVGPNKSGFFEDFKAEIDARQDVMSQIVNHPSQGLEQVAAQLQSLVRVNSDGLSIPVMPHTHSPSDVYQRHKSGYASAFLNMRKARGDDAAIAWAKRQLFQNPPQFSKQ